jgi:hypothetical protein
VIAPRASHLTTRETTTTPDTREDTMDVENANELPRTLAVHALVRVLRRPEADPRAVWSTADGVLDALAAAPVAQPALRAEVDALMRAIAARAPVHAPATARRILALAEAAGGTPRRRTPALAG